MQACFCSSLHGRGVYWTFCDKTRNIASLIMKMKKLLLSLLILSAGLAGCKKSYDSCETVTVTAPAEEVNKLEQYMLDQHIEAIKDNRGFYYRIYNPGSGNKPTICSTVTVNYSGTLSNGDQFDAANNISFGLGQLITGWQEAIPLIAKGGNITIYLPPSLAYGSQTNGNIPANSILIFNIELVNVQ